MPHRSRLLRNCPVGHLTRLEIDERKAQMFGSLPETAKDMRPMLRVVGVGARVARDHSIMKVANDRTGVGSRPGGTATKCSADPQSIRAAFGLMWSRTDGETRGFDD
jgi:hypothetical protein